jgi:hypothetical protein
MSRPFWFDLSVNILQLTLRDVTSSAAQVAECHITNRKELQGKRSQSNLRRYVPKIIWIYYLPSYFGSSSYALSKEFSTKFMYIWFSPSSTATLSGCRSCLNFTIVKQPYLANRFNDYQWSNRSSINGRSMEVLSFKSYRNFMRVDGEKPLYIRKLGPWIWVNFQWRSNLKEKLNQKKIIYTNTIHPHTSGRE